MLGTRGNGDVRAVVRDFPRNSNAESLWQCVDY
jgi:hypothetical protein